MKKAVQFFYPGGSYPSLSITGTSCALSCEHCSGRYLSGMFDTSGEGSLLAKALEVEDRGGKGFLLSGGCGPSGGLVFTDDILEQIARIKDETDLSINVHTGLVSRETAQDLSSSGVDSISFDVHTDREVIRDVLHLKVGADAFIRSYDHLEEVGLRVVPHVLAGINWGRIGGEYDAVDFISSREPDTAVLIVLIPTKGTGMEGVRPPSNREIIRLGRYMVDALGSRMYLGCMRPKGDPDLERSLLRSGFSGIVNPRRVTRKWALDLDWKIEEYDICCSMWPYHEPTHC